MAKELPFFKFEPNQWENGNIQMCSREARGLFIDMCSVYWSRLGDLPLKLAIQKLCAGNATALNPLIDENIIAINDGQITIEFLDEQLQEFKETSSQNSRNAKKRWEKVKPSKDLSEGNATALISQSDGNAIREDKIREEKINNIINSEKVENLEIVNRSLVAGEMPIKEIAKEIAELEKNHPQREAIARKFKINNPKVLQWALSKFNTHKRSLGEFTDTHKNYSRHLNNWLNLQDIQSIHQDYFQELKRQTEKQ